LDGHQLFDELFTSFTKVMKVMLKKANKFSNNQAKQKNKRRTRMTLSCFFLNNKKVKNYPHKYEEGEKQKEMV
jgi:uncharacterized membrane-anchored protein YhcB (DUF1043 family)